MKRKIGLIQILLTIALSILCCFALFGCGGKKAKAPEVKDVSITAVDGVSHGKTGAHHKVTYTAPEGSKIATSVMLGESVATVTDYSYLNGEYIFYTVGEYTITVYASKDGMLGYASAKITVQDGEGSVSDVKVSAAAGEAFGKAGALHVLTYTADDDCEIAVEIKKDGAAATDAVFNSEYNTIVFGSAGKYTVKVTATKGEVTGSAETEIEIGVTDQPTVTLSLDKSTVDEDGEVTLRHTVTYADGDLCESESVSALYRAGNSGEFLEAEEGTYTVNGDRFTPHVAGNWKVVYRAQSKGGAVGEESASLKCNPLQISLSYKTQERQRIQTEKPTDIDYLVSGAADKYDVTYDLHGKDKIKAEKGAGNSVRITASTVDYFTVTVVYTHKVNTSLKKTIDIDLYSVESLTYAPTLGGDPFNGMPSEVLTSMGHMLYFDAAPCALHGHELTYEDVQYEIQNASITSGATASIMYAADDINYPYVLVSHFGQYNNSATGSFTIKMTVTDPATGYSAIAYKDFTVTPTRSNPAAIRNFVRNNSFYDIDQMNFDNAAQYSQENMVLTKTGMIIQRLASDFSTGDFAHMEFNSAAKNNRLEFKFNLLGLHPNSGDVWLGIGVRTVIQTGWVGFFNLHIVGGKLDITNGLSTAVTGEYVSDAERPEAKIGTTMYLRIDRRVNGSVAEYTVYAKTEENAAYEQYYRCTYAVSTEDKNAGAPVKEYQFTHTSGCYSIEDVTIANYDA